MRNVSASVRAAMLFLALAAFGLLLIFASIDRDDGAFLGWLFLFYVFTSSLLLLTAYQRRRAEREWRLELMESETRFRTLSERAPVGIFIIQDGVFRYVNPAFADIFGYEVEEVIDHLAPTDLAAAEDRQMVAAKVRGTPEAESTVSHFFLHGRRKDGRTIDCEVLGRRTDYHGRPAIVGTLLDITERKAGEQALRQSEERLRTYFEEANDWIFTLDAEGIITSVNRKMTESSGYSAEELIGHRATEFFNEDRAQRVEELLQGIARRDNIERVELKLPLPDGEEIWLEIRGRTLVEDGELTGTFHIARDVTERKQAEAAERQQRVLAEALRDTATVLNSTLDLDQVLERILDNVGRVVPHDGANIMLLEDGVASVVRCQGYYQQQGLTEEVLSLQFHIDNTLNFRKMVATGQPYVIPDTSHDPAWINVPATSWVRSYIGAPISRGEDVIGFINLDSSEPQFFTPLHAERLQAFADQVAIALQNAQLYQELENYSEALEQAVTVRTVEMRRVMEQVQVILNNSPDAILLLRPDGTIKTANPACQEMFGFEPDEAERRQVHDLVAPEATDLFAEAIQAVIERGEKRRLELPAQREDGATFDADLALAPVMEDGVVRGGVCSVRDISNLKEVERMKDAFVTNVSHELRTPITSLRLYHDLLVRNPEKANIYLQRLEREINRLNAIIEDLLRLSRLDRGRVDITLEEVDLNELVEEYVHDRLPLAHRKGLSLEFMPATSVPPVDADRSLLEQVLGILLTNALNYTPAGGEIVVTVRHARRDRRQWVNCAVCDTGQGIAPKEQEQLFDRFFRGQAAHESGTPGTGLGLAIAREIIERHGGLIEVASDGVPGEGSEFSVWLPASEPST
ncbi:MAG TPA: PAS domain S-box protein [Candidatus Sulfomarinibacteraceae bacterium]|nr:PAS domain S-box protein [Candidatus Sulfomarinibacteraceae bacterium]